jgi:hypothetical protein
VCCAVTTVAIATVVTDQSWKIQSTQRHTATGGCMCRIMRLLMIGPFQLICNLLHISRVTGAQCFLRNYELRYTLWEGKFCYFVHRGCVLGQMYLVSILVHFYKTTPNVTLLPKPVSHRFSLSFTLFTKKFSLSLCLLLFLSISRH